MFDGHGVQCVYLRASERKKMVRLLKIYLLHIIYMIMIAYEMQPIGFSKSSFGFIVLKRETKNV